MDGETGRARARIACVGDNCIDRYLAPIDRSFAAGNAFNVAVWLRRMGFAVDYFGAVGDDEDGRTVRAALAAEGVGVDHVVVLPEPTSVTDIVVSPLGEREFVRVSEGAAEAYGPDGEATAALSSYALVHAVNLTARPAVVDPLVRAGVPVTYDFDDALELAAVAGLEIAFFSPDDAAPTARVDDLLTRAVGAGARAAVALCGPGGSAGCDGGDIVRVPALGAAPLDTCGAGDSYIAAAVAARLAGGDLRTAMLAGGGLAADVCGHVGALPPGLPKAVPRPVMPEPLEAS